MYAHVHSLFCATHVCMHTWYAPGPSGAWLLAPAAQIVWVPNCGGDEEKNALLTVHGLGFPSVAAFGCACAHSLALRYA